MRFEEKAVNLPYYITWTQQKGALTLPIQRAENGYFFLESGEKVDDMVSTSFQSSFGYSNGPIKEAILHQLEELPLASPKAAFALKEEATQKLIQLLGQTGGKVFYTVSGAEAIENALKMVRQIRPGKLILTREKSYHGATLGAMSISGDWRSEAHDNVSEWTRVIPEPKDDPDLAITRQIIESAQPQNIAAFCLETITAANGVIIPDQSWWQGIQALCEEFNIFLIVDEVACGFGRTGKPFAFQNYGLQPDLVCMSKAITGGYVPFGAVWTHETIAQYYEETVLACGLTSYAHPLGMAAMNAVLDQLTDPVFLRHICALEHVFTQQLEQIRALSPVTEIRQKGLFAAIETEGTSLDWKRFIQQGLHLFLKNSMIILAPPFVMSEEALEDALQRVKRLITEGTHS